MIRAARSDLAEAALVYAARGIPIFPLSPRSKIPLFPGAHAEGHACRGECGRMGHGVYDATTDLDRAGSWWVRWPQANIGLACGPGSDLLVLDPDGEEGRAALARLEGEMGPLPPTTRVRTGRLDGGEHLYFRFPARVPRVRGRLALHLDVLGAGRYVVAPPSVHPSGRRYDFERPRRPRASLPSAWCERVAAIHAPRFAHSVVPAPIPTEAVRRARAYIARIPGAVSGERGHDRTFHVACVLVEGFALAPDDALALLSEWNASCSPPWSERELRHKVSDAVTRASDVGRLLAAGPRR